MFLSVAKNFSILTAARIAEFAIAFLFIAFTARHLGPALFGKYILIGAYMRFVSLIINGGVGPIAFRELARCRDQAGELFDDIISMRLALGVTGYLAMMSVVILTSHDQEVLVILAVAGLTLIIEPFRESYAAYYTAHERMGIPSAYAVSLTSLNALTGCALLLAGYGVFALFASYVALSLAVTVGWSMQFRARMLRFRLRLRFSAWRRLFLLIIPFAPIHISNQMNRVLNVILLGRLAGPLPMEQSVGYYSPAQSATNAVVTLVTGMRRALIPPITVRLSQGHTVTREMDVAVKLVIAVFCLPLVLSTWYMAPEFILLLFGDQYGPSAQVLVMLGCAGALEIAALVPESFLFSHPEHKLQDYIAGPVTTVLANLLLCVCLIGEYGVTGAAAAAITARVVYFLFATHYCRRQMQGQALRPRNFADALVLIASSFAVWHFTFGWIDYAWFAFPVAGLLTLPLLGAFIFHLRPRAPGPRPG